MTHAEEPEGGEFVDPRPRDEAAERAVLGAMMLNADAVAEVSRLLQIEDFYRPAHTAVFEAIVSLYEAGKPTDPVAVAAQLSRRGELVRVGGAPYLHTLIAEVPTAANASYYADLVSECATRARLIEAAQYIDQLVRSGQTEGVAQRARDAIERATAERVDADSGAWVGEVIDDHLASWDEKAPDGVLEWPYQHMQDLTNGAKAGQLIAIAGRPGVGKSTVAMDWARHAASDGKTVMFTSLEMSRDELLMRLTCAEASVRFSEAKKGPEARFTADERLDLRNARQRIKDMLLRIEDQFDMTLSQIRATARKMARGESGLDMLVVDHIGLVTPADSKVTRQEQVAGFSRGLKNLAKELAIPVIEVVQLNRGPEARIDKKPQLADLRESGALEQDADVVVLVYRPDAHDKETPRAGEADLIVAKHRGGPTSTVSISHQLHFCRFNDASRRDDYERERKDIA